MTASTHVQRLVGIEEEGSSSAGAACVRTSVGLISSMSAGPLSRLVSAPTQSSARPALDDVYREHFSFVWRSAKRLGIGESSLDDVVQEVFVIVHRRLGEFEGRSSLRTWLFGITLRVARDHRRSAARKSADGSVDLDTLVATSPGPGEALEKADAVRLLHAILDQMDDERREIFVMAELEQLSMPDISETLGINVNTAYARLRAARQSFEDALARHRARDEWRLR
jgi:RNA polymerase sigma-70 factor (ECF subfamily)